MNLIADVGGTNIRCALVDKDLTPVAVQSFPNAGFDSLNGALQNYLNDQPRHPIEAAIAVAGPITGDSVRMTNRQWHFSILELQQELGVRKLTVINDFTAVALSLPHLGKRDVVGIGTGRAAPGAAMAAIGPGTGLGVSGLIPGPDCWAPVAGEGGHVSLAPATAQESRVVNAIHDRFGHCSAERVVSGPGLVLLYNTLREIDGKSARELKPRDVTTRADGNDAYATEALDMFFAFLGSVAGNLALTLGALGGVYIAGGIAPMLLDRMKDSAFRDRFEAKGRYAGYLQAIPTAVITHDTPALLGLATLVQTTEQD